MFSIEFFLGLKDLLFLGVRNGLCLMVGLCCLSVSPNSVSTLWGSYGK